MDAILLAGGVPDPESPLYPYTQGKPKALLEIAGKPMVQWVLDALSATQEIDQIVLVGPGPEDGISSPKLVASIPDQGALLRNAIAGAECLLEIDPSAQQVLMCSGDIPLITSDMVVDLMAQCTDPAIDLYYPIVARTLMEERFPASERSYVHLTDGDFAGADLFIVNPRIAHTNRELMETLAESRKHAFKLVRQFGLVLLLKLLLRRLSLAEAEARVSAATNLRAHVVLASHAELGMDVDKPFQLDICRQALSSR